MTFEEVAAEIKKHAAKIPPIGKTIKLVVDEGVVFVDMTGESISVDHVDRDADCTVKTKIKTLQSLKEGKINPMMAVMTGKVKIKGDMGVAMKLQSLLGG